MRPSRRFGLWLLAIALLLGSAYAASAAAETKSKAPQVRVELIAEQDGIQPGATFWVGLRQRIAPGWHTYWSNPGDSGEPTTIDWTLPAGFKAGEIVWPHPERIPLGSAMGFGYSGEVVLLTEIAAPSDFDPGTRATLHGRASWLVCALRDRPPPRIGTRRPSA